MWTAVEQRCFLRKPLSCALSSILVVAISIALCAAGAPGAAQAADSREYRPIKSIEVTGPVFPFESHGDLWFTTWADDGSVFVSWGDGRGPLYGGPDDFSHNGLARLTGSFPDVSAEIVKRFMPLSDDDNNSKPTSLLFIDGRLYVAIHSPLLDPVMGFIAYSDDYGKTFKYDLDNARALKRNKNFICLMFINMGRSYELNGDGFVYAFGVEAEINKSGKVYLARMPVDGILDESTWTYFAGMKKKHEARWSGDFKKARRIRELTNREHATMFPNLLFSAAYHPGSDRYLVLTAATMEGKLYEAPSPWGPWSEAAKWFDGKDNPWYSSYMPGIITKDMGPDTFYFTASGRTVFDPQPGDTNYALKFGKIRMSFD